MSPLEKTIREKILADGPMPFAEYMEMCVEHYYATRDPFGVDGDFTTAPEISQLFGEMIALWAIEAWQKLGEPKEFTLLECGPGRGTLMKDVLRTTKTVPDFLKAARITLYEFSPILREKQRAALQGQNAVWTDNLEALPSLPCIMIANEFFDAFPVQRFVEVNGEWVEQMVVIENDQLKLAPPAAKNTKEKSPATLTWVKKFSAHIKTHRGAALIIDYAYEGKEYVDSVQALKAHEFVEVLESPGACDLTAYVDYSTLRQAAEENGLPTPPSITQREFLRRYGIEMRLAQLLRNATSEQAENLQSGVDRLLDKTQMGDMFKVMEIFSD